MSKAAHVDIVTRHWGSKSVFKLDRLGVTVLCVLPDGYRISQGGSERDATFGDIANLLGWA